MSSPTAHDIAALVAAGQIEAAIAANTATLGAPGISTPERMALLKQRYFSNELLKMLINGNLSPENAVSVTHYSATEIDATAAPIESLLRRGNQEVANGDYVVDAGCVADVNSTLVLDYVINDISPDARAVGFVLSSVFEQPPYAEMRTKQQLG